MEKPKNNIKIKKMTDKPGEWLKGKGPEHDIVISCRIRLARNVENFVFSEYLSSKVSKELVDLVQKSIKKSDYLKKNIFFKGEELTELDRKILMERHLVSQEYVKGNKPTGVCITENEIVSIMINEEDHLRIQVLQSGFSLDDGWQLTNLIDDELEKNLQYSFDPKLGFLTACPTNVGTGLRASCMLHIPALVMTKQINKVIQALSKLNIAVRGLYGEGTQASGNFFQFSNQITLGKSEEEIIAELEKVVKQIVDHENEARTALKDKKADKLSDQVWRSVGILKAARIISSNETNSLLSLLRLGLDLGIIKNITKQRLNELFILIQPAHLQRIHGKNLSVSKRDETRANLVRDKLKDITLE